MSATVPNASAAVVHGASASRASAAAGGTGGTGCPAGVTAHQDIHMRSDVYISLQIALCAALGTGGIHTLFQSCKGNSSGSRSDAQGNQKTDQIIRP